MKSLTQRIIGVVAMLCAFNLCVFAQEEADDKTLSPYFVVKSVDPNTDRLPLKSCTADVNIAGVIADVTINQVYKNEGKNKLEAIYVFPASTNAAVYSMEMTIGKRKITAQIREKKKAREEYEQAKNDGKRASLLEQERPNVFQMNVTNIMPGDEIIVTMKYTELLIPESATYQFVFPTVVGPRYSNESASGAAQKDKFVATPYTHQGVEPSILFDIKIGLAAGMPIQNVNSTSHKVNISYPNTETASIKLDPSESKGGNRDFILDYKLAGSGIQTGLLLFEDKDEMFFLMMVQPPKTVKLEEIPPREYIFIVDVSGSMRGFPLDITKKLMRNLIVNLKPTDKFNVLLFSGTSGWLSESSLPATAENMDKAVNLIDNQKGGSGTELLPALQKALTFPRQSEALSRSFVIVTDGYVTVEREALELIAKNCDNANTFSFGIGSDVNRYLVEGMARAGSGEPMIVTKPEFADAQAEKFRKYINHPVFTQIKRDFGQFQAYDVEPITLPDVLAERPVIIFGKYKGTPSGTITLKGYAGSKKHSVSLDASKYKADPKNSALRYLWARKRIQMLDDYNNASGENEVLVKQVTDLGLKYNLLTAYTSFIAIDQEQTVGKDGKLVTVKQELPLPENVSDAAVGFDNGGEDADGKAMLAKEQEEILYYSSIKINTELKSEDKTKVNRLIEEQIQRNLNKCLSFDGKMPSIVRIKTDDKGNVTEILFPGTAPDNVIEDCIRKAINQWNFGSLNLNLTLSFDINL